MNIKSLKTSNIIAYLAMVFLNYLSNALPINGNTAGELSDRYVNYFVPAGLTFAIWGLIYGWLLVFLSYQIISFFNENIASRVNPIVEKIGILFVISCALNMAWLMAWHYHYIGLSVLIMLSFLMLLLFLFLKVGVGFNKINNLEKWISHAPFSIYLGWISIATIANVTAFLVDIQWAGFGIKAVIWAKIMIVIGSMLASFVVWQRNSIFYGFVVIWVFWGISLKRSLIADIASLEIEMFAYFGIGFVSLSVILRAQKWLTY